LCAILCVNITETLYKDDIDNKCIEYLIELPSYAKEEIHPNYYTCPKNVQCLLQILKKGVQPQHMVSYLVLC